MNCTMISSRRPRPETGVFVRILGRIAVSFAMVSAAGIVSAPGAEGSRVLLLDHGVPVWVDRASSDDATSQATGVDGANPASRLRAAVERQLAGPTAAERDAGLEGFFPEGTRLDEVEVVDGRATLFLTFPREFCAGGLEETWTEQLSWWTARLGEESAGIGSLAIRARAAGSDRYEPARRLSKPLPPPTDKPEDDATDVDPGLSLVPTGPGQPPVRGQPQPSGALSDASIFLSPGHGWYYSSVLKRWATQRGNNNQLIEDMSNGEAVLQFLTHYLWNAGARVYTCRERDLNTNMVIVDNTDPGFSVSGTWAVSSNVSGHYGSNYRWHWVHASETAVARWTPDIPETGYYAVYIWWPAASDRSIDARFTVRHTGGATTWIQNQQRDGKTWKYIGTYHFEAGTHPDTGSVELSDLGTNGSQVVVADAVRFGGGMGDVPDNVSGTVSGKPRWEESGRYYAGFAGKSDWASYGTVSAMPRYAKWEAESWEAGKCAYVSWHSNAGGGSGTSTYAYSSDGWDGAFDGVAGGDKLRNYIHDEVVNDIRAGWDAGWTNRGKHTADFGELNPNNNNEMPAALIEVAFHDLAADAEDLLDPNFRRLVARAVYQGIVKFYVSEVPGFTNSTLLPEPPTNLRVGNFPGGDVAVLWDPPPYDTGNGLFGDPATGYRVYRSTDGKGFDNGTDVTGTSLTVSGLTPGEVYYFRVTAVNAGGESFPTETLAVRVHSEGTPPILIVNGFDRIDGSANIREDDPYSSRPLQRGYLWLMNTYDYVIAHAEAVAANGGSFDSCSNEAVIDGQVSLGNYDIVLWILGEESTADSTFDSVEQAKVTEFLDAGGRLFVSGSEIGWDLEAQGNGVDFYRNVLRGDYLSDDAGTYFVGDAPGGIFEGIGSFRFDDGTQIYNVDWPDTVAGINGSTICLRYSTTGSPGAAIQYDGGSPDRRVVMLAFPFESIRDPAVREELMGRVLDFFGRELPDGLATY